MKKYLIDTNICIFFIKGRYNLNQKFQQAKLENCFISEITLGELMFGVENSEHTEANRETLNNFTSGLNIIPIFNALPVYAKEKARLRKSGTTIDDFDLLIGAKAVAHGMIMVTNNISHFTRIQGIVLEDWTKQK